MARRQRGEGAVYQRHTSECPPLVDGPPGEDGKPTKIRPGHACRAGWAAMLDLGYRDGKRRRKVIYGKTQRAVIKKLGDAKRDLATNGDIPTAGMTTEAWLRKWVEEICPAKAKMKPKTLQEYRSRVETYLIPAIGRVRLDKLTPAHVREVRNYIVDTLGLSTTTAMHAHARLHTALNDAMREGILSRNVASLVSAPTKAPSDARGLSVPEAVALIRHVAGDRYGSRWLAGLLLGARQGELLGLEWNRLDLQDGTADLSWQLQRIPYRHACGDRTADRTWPCGRRGADRCPAKVLDTQPGFEYRQLDGNLCLQRPKTARSTRFVPLPAPLTTALIARREQYHAEQDGYTVDHGLVWPRTDGRPTTSESDAVAWHEHLAAAGIPQMKQHAARHTTATLLLTLGVPQEVIMSILGHSDAVTTRGYQHIDLALQRAALAQLATVIDGQSPDRAIAATQTSTPSPVITPPSTSTSTAS